MSHLNGQKGEQAGRVCPMDDITIRRASNKLWMRNNPHLILQRVRSRTHGSKHPLRCVHDVGNGMEDMLL